MPHSHIKKSIQELKQQLKAVPEETGVLEATLDNAMESIERYTPEALQEFAWTLQQEAEAFEVEHPKITSLINQVMMALSNIGI